MNLFAIFLENKSALSILVKNSLLKFETKKVVNLKYLDVVKLRGAFNPRSLVQRLGDPAFQGEELNQDDLKIVENYSLQIETSQGRRDATVPPPLTGIPSLDGVRATPGDTRDRIVGALGRLGLPTDGSGAASITGRRVMRYLFTEILKL